MNIEKINSRWYKAYYVADYIDLESFQKANPTSLVSESGTELYYKFGWVQAVFILSYGTIVFANFPEDKIDKILSDLKEHCSNWEECPVKLELKLVHDDIINVNLDFGVLKIRNFNREVNKLIMLDLALNVSKNYYKGLQDRISKKIENHSHLLYSKCRNKLIANNIFEFSESKLSRWNF